MTRRDLAYVLDSTGVTEAMLQTRSRMNPARLTVLTYHRVHDDADAQPFDRDVIDATTEEFERQIATLKRHFTLIGVSELRAVLRGGAMPTNPAIVSFDDGYRDCYDRVLPILLAQGVKGVFFIATSYVTHRRLFWWDRIAYLLQQSQNDHIALRYPCEMVLDLTGSSRDRSKRIVLDVVKSWPGIDLERFLEALTEAAGLSWSPELERSLADQLVMTWEQIVKLRAAGMEVHSHTCTHRVLELMPSNELIDELSGARADLEEHLGERVQGIAYPVGRSVARFPALRAAVQDAGYDVGFSNGSGVSSLSGDVDPLNLRRISLERGLPHSYFRAQLAIPGFAVVAGRRTGRDVNARSGTLASVKRGRLGFCPGAVSAKPTAVACTIIREFDDLLRLETVWRDLLTRSSTDVPTLSPLWIINWWRVFGSSGGRRLRVAVFTHGDRVVGLAPLLARPQVYRPGIPFRRLELLASGEPESDETCSEYLGVIAEPGFEEPVAFALASALSRRVFGSWDEVLFPAMAGDDSMPPLLLHALESTGITAESVSHGACSYIELPRRWEDYMQSISSSGRYVIRRSQRDFDTWAGDSVELREARTPAELADGARVLKALHSERWSGGGAFGSKRFTAFHDAVMRDLLVQNRLELLWLVARGRPVAAIYNVLWNDKAYFYQGGRALDLPKGVRPGIVLHAYAIRRAIVARRREYDFLAGQSQYKRQLATATRPLVRIRAVRAPIRDFVRATADRGFRRAGDFRRLVLGI